MSRVTAKQFQDAVNLHAHLPVELAKRCCCPEYTFGKDDIDSRTLHFANCPCHRWLLTQLGTKEFDQPLGGP